ncbi:MAG: hypothetical protein ACP5II_00395 [Infirmifilum sp.]|uniref:hypothetical protein n=1 Tax=Infirmifilum TaxID=2856573 RepID=UPI003C761FDC
MASKTLFYKGFFQDPKERGLLFIEETFKHVPMLPLLPKCRIDAVKHYPAVWRMSA